MPSPIQRAAASTVLRSAPAAANRRGRVLGVFASAVYAELGEDLISLEASDALRLPCAIVLPVATAARPFATLQPGAVVTANGLEPDVGRLTVGSLTVDVVRWWRPRRPRTVDAYDETRLSDLAAALPPLNSLVRDGVAALVRALAGHRDLTLQTGGLLGLGDGLTPEGDDVLAGLLVALRSRPTTRDLADRLGDAVTLGARSRTNTVSAGLLRHAADGHAVPRLVDVLDRLGGDGPESALPTTVVRLLAVGHTSGTALAHGVLAAGRLHAAMHVRSEVA